MKVIFFNSLIVEIFYFLIAKLKFLYDSRQLKHKTSKYFSPYWQQNNLQIELFSK